MSDRESEASFEVQRMGVLPCPLCRSGDVRFTDWGIKCKGCGIALYEPSEASEDSRDRWNALPRLATLADQPDGREEREPVWPEPGTFGACYDCGRRYGAEYGFPDLVVPHGVWNAHLSPRGGEGGLLCPSCMCRRAAAAGITCEARFTSGPFATPNPVPGTGEREERA